MSKVVHPIKAANVLCQLQCVLCSEILDAERMKPLNFKRHLETKHSNYKDTPVGTGSEHIR